MKKAGIISIGNELLSGQTIDTNTSYLSRELLGLGIPVVCAFTVADEVSAIVRALEQGAQQAEILVVTGGLGPTDDDVTRQGLARFLGVELEFNQELFQEISEFFERRGYAMAESNRIQAYLPAGARGLSNRMGTAPGMSVENGGEFIFCMPGVPREMEVMFAESVRPVLEGVVSGQAVVTRKVMCFGAGESAIADRLGDMMQRGRNPLINSTAGAGVITLHIVATAMERRQAENMAEAERVRLVELLGDIIYGYDGETLAEAVGKKLLQFGKTLAVAESCTGGLVAKMVTDVPGASEYFRQGWVTYCNEAKTSQLGVDPGLIESHGAVSEEVACAMSAGAMEKSGADYAIGITGIAGPGGGTDEKPVGLVYISVSGRLRGPCRRYVFSHSREFVRLRSALTALDLLRREID